MIRRFIQTLVRERLRTYPAVALLGPRQSGKTTLAKFLGKSYFDLEKQQDRLRLDVEWREIASRKAVVVLDEAQSMPELFPRLRSAIDEDRKRTGRFLLLGSIAPALMQRVGESLAGRLALCELAPFTVRELPQGRWDELWFSGGYPDGGILDLSQYPSWQRNYLDLMAQRDLPNWGLPAQPATTQRLFQMLAAWHGQTWNASQIGKSLGLSYHTVSKYVDFLESVYLVRRLPAYSTNVRKRLVKSPKLYWRDSGLLHSLLGVIQSDELLSRPWVGASWEGWVIEQILSTLSAAGCVFQAFYLRTSDQHEVDLVLDFGGRLWVFEVKLTNHPDLADLKRLTAIGEMIKADRFVLISRTTDPVRGKTEFSLNLSAALDLLLE